MTHKTMWMTIAITTAAILAMTSPIQAIYATVLDLSGESSGGDTSGNFLPRAPPPDFPGTGPMFDAPQFQSRPSPSDSGSPSDSSQPQEQEIDPRTDTRGFENGQREFYVDVNAPAEEFCEQVLAMPKPAQEQFVENLVEKDIGAGFKALGKLMTCAEDLMSNFGG